MKFNFKIRWSVIIPSIIVVIALIILVAGTFYFYPVVAVSIKSVKPVANFQYKDTLTCTTVYTTYRQPGMFGIKLPWLEYDKFTLKGLNADTLQVVVDGKSLGNWQKVYDGDIYLTIQRTPASWNMDTIGLMKDTGAFVRTISGLQAGDVKFHYVIAQKGRCQ
ncbi:hypothetical protein IID19_05265 [Patescibacteria group bacterium]|nr:hypothetical protein [Patescibacteria group bacterium]